MSNTKSQSEQKLFDTLITPKQFSEFLGIKLSTAYQWLNERRLPTVKLGSSIRVRESEVEKFIRQNERPALRQRLCTSAMGGAL